MSISRPIPNLPVFLRTLASEGPFFLRSLIPMHFLPVSSARLYFDELPLFFHGRLVIGQLVVIVGSLENSYPLLWIT